MDLMMPEMDGIAATRAILADYPDIKIIAMTSFEEEELVHGVLAAGAISYLIKNVTSDELAKRNPGRGFGQIDAFSRSRQGADSSNSPDEAAFV